MNADWRKLSPTKLLETVEVLSLEQVAYVLDLRHYRGAVKGTLDPGLVRKLVDAGSLRLIDPSQPRPYWRIAAAEVRRYRDGEPRRARMVGVA